MVRIDYARDSLLIEEELSKVFNFISRGAQYERWHLDYHLAAQIMDIKEGGVGSVFSIENSSEAFTSSTWEG